MPRIVGIDLPKEKIIEKALTYIYGIGPSNSKLILKSAGIDSHKRSKDLTEEEISNITSIIQATYKTEGDLRKIVSTNIKRLIDTGTYRGSRHRRGLPVRGQRTRTNARTRKGPKKTVGIVRAKAAKRPAGAGGTDEKK